MAIGHEGTYFLKTKHQFYWHFGSHYPELSDYFEKDEKSGGKKVDSIQVGPTTNLVILVSS